MSNVKIIIGSISSDLKEVVIAIDENWKTLETDVSAGTDVIATDNVSMPSIAWAQWVVFGDVGTKFTIECIINGNQQWKTTRKIKMSRAYHSGLRRILS